MDVFDAVRSLLAVRQYRPDPIPDDVVRRILESARLSGSASNKQPWHFVVVQDHDTIQEVARAVPTAPFAAGAPLVILVAVEKTRFAFSDASRAIQSMMLTAWDAGVGSTQAGGPGMDQLKQLLGIPDDLDVVAVLPFGYPALDVGAGKKNRKLLGEIASRERYGEPFE
jgi:nitroreductase